LKRTLEVLSLVLILVGIELATGSLSYALGRLERVYRALSVGNEPEVSLVRFAVGTLMVLLGAIIVTVLFWARFSARFVGAVSFCPHCGGKTTRIHRRSRHRLLGMILGMPVTRRKCSDCGWRGLTALT
jgi:predicted RNA-binding Zn-ribbon protein involved in translation (DUF1610 family)